jgi:hypothetical protein
MATDTSQKETALAKPSEVTIGGHSLASIIQQQLWKSDELAKVTNMTFPVTALDVLPPMHVPSLSVIRVNVDPRSKDTYPINADQKGLSKHVVLKMLNAAGASYRTQKLTPDSELDLIRWTALVWGKLPDGTFHQAQGSKAWSWEKCQAEMTAQQAKQYRQFADEQTETKALLRAARAWLNIKISYSNDELTKPFLIARSVPALDVSDPEIKRMVAQRMVDSTFALYGTPDPAPALPPLSVPELPAEASPEEFEDNGGDADGRGESGTFQGGRATPPATPSDPHNSEPQAPDAPPPLEEKAPVDAEASEGEPLSLVHPTPAEQRQAEKREIIEDLNGSVAGGQLDKATVRDITRDVLGLRNGQATPHLSVLDLPSLRSVRARAREAKARA